MDSKVRGTNDSKLKRSFLLVLRRRSCPCRPDAMLGGASLRYTMRCLTRQLTDNQPIYKVAGMCPRILQHEFLFSDNLIALGGDLPRETGT